MRKIFILLAAALFLALPALSEELTTAYIMCQPNDYINVRLRPTTKSESCGRYITGDSFYTDGHKQNGFLHAEVSLEVSDAWIYSGYVVYDEPVYVGRPYTVTANGRVSARKYINGPRRCWVKKNSTVTVYYMSSEWSLTNKGYIQTKYLQPAE